MSQQQILLLILAVFVVGIVIGIAAMLFNSNAVVANRDAIIHQLNVVAADAHQFSMKPEALGGGSGSYANYAIPSGLTSDINGLYMLTVHSEKGKDKGKDKGKGAGRSSASTGALTLIGTSVHGYGTVTMVIDDSAEIVNIFFTGNFNEN